jgi:hypothetical protein
VLACVSFVILLGPRIVHAEVGQTLLTKNDSNMDGLKQHLTDNLVKSVDAIQVSKDVLTESMQQPLKIKKDIDHAIKPVHNIVTGAANGIKEGTQARPNKAGKVQPKGDGKSQLPTPKTYKPIHTSVYKKLKTQIHLKPVKHYQIEKSTHHQHRKGAQNQDSPLLTSNSILQPYERSNSSENKTNNDSNGSNLFGFLDNHWFKKKAISKEPFYLGEKSGAQWENAPPSPPPEHPLHFLSFEKNRK